MPNQAVGLVQFGDTFWVLPWLELPFKWIEIRRGNRCRPIESSWQSQAVLSPFVFSLGLRKSRIRESGVGSCLRVSEMTPLETILPGPDGRFANTTAQVKYYKQDLVVILKNLSIMVMKQAQILAR